MYGEGAVKGAEGEGHGGEEEEEGYRRMGVGDVGGWV